MDWQLVEVSLFSHAIRDHEEVLLVTVHHWSQQYLWMDDYCAMNGR